MRVKEKSEIAGLKSKLKKKKKKKLRSWCMVPSLHGKEKGKKVETVTDFIFFGSRITEE